MDFDRIKELSGKPRLYERGSSVMWSDPHISKQLLKLHLNPEHDVASRNKIKIETTVNWIITQTNNSGMEILDLGCGPGLYAELLAQKGHSVTGVDFSENSIRYASKRAKEQHLEITYLNQNYLDLDIADKFDLVIMIYLDFCVLLPDERDKLLDNIHRALKRGGKFICDVVNEKNIDMKILPQSWEVSKSGFWKDSPYIALVNGYHYPEAKVLVNQHIIIGENDSIDTYILWTHYYEAKDLVKIFRSHGFGNTLCFNNVLPEYNNSPIGEKVDFYVSEKI